MLFFLTDTGHDTHKIRPFFSKLQKNHLPPMKLPYSKSNHYPFLTHYCATGLRKLFQTLHLGHNTANRVTGYSGYNAMPELKTPRFKFP